MTKNNIPCKKLSLNCIQHSQTRKEHILIKHVFSKKLQQIYILQGHMVEPCYIQDAQKQPLADVLQNRCSGKFYWIHWKMPQLKSIFHKVAGLDWLQRKCFSMNLLNFQEHLFYRTPRAAASGSFSRNYFCYWKGVEWPLVV